jgi:hypothetical protein
MKRLIFLLVLAPVLLAGPALAVAPSTMSYQGVLMDAGGALVPDGDYSLTFRLYTVAAGGVALWTETQSPVAVSRGGFHVILGSVAPLTGVPFDVPYWLGITVGAGAEMAPRVQLASSPYGLSLRLPFAGGVSSTGPALAIANTGSGPAITADRSLVVGTAANDGTLQLYENGIVGAEMGNWISSGGYLHLLDNIGNWIMRIEPDIDGGGAGWFQVPGSGGAFTVDGNLGSGGPQVAIAGPSSATYFNTTASGNSAVHLPADAVSAAEILDEPGIAQAHDNGGPPFDTGTSSATVDILGVSISIPDAGYIVLTANAQFGLFTENAIAGMQITEVSRAPTDWSHYFYVGGASVSSGTVTLGYVPVNIHRTYYKAAAGTYTFYFQAWNEYNATSGYAWSPTLTALYTPVSYGSVVTSATAAELPRFESVTPTSAAGNGPGRPAVSGALVDLRELELRATRERLEAEQAERRLIEAKLADQNGRSAAKPAEGK